MSGGAKFLIGFILIGVSIAVLAGLFNNQGQTAPLVENNKELVGNVTFKNGQFRVSNQEAEDWKMCRFSVNGKYDYPSQSRLDILKAGESISIRAMEFTLSDGTRFNYFNIKPNNFSASCNGRIGVWQWK